MPIPHQSSFNTIITWGKFKGSSLGFIASTNPSYLIWLSETDHMPEIWRLAAAKTLLGESVESLSLPKSSTKHYGPTPPSGGQPGIILVNKKIAAIKFPFDRALLERFKLEIDGRTWNAEGGYWEIPAVKLPRAVEVFGGMNAVKMGPGVKELIETELLRREDLDIIRDKDDTKLNIPGLLLPLRPYQRVAVEFVVRAGGRALIADEMGLGKLQPLDAKIVTPTGWKLMGDISIGDCVIGSNGHPVKVVGVYPNGIMNIYRVTFNDGSFTECGNEHLWAINTTTRNFRNNPYKVMMLKDIKENLTFKNGNNRYFIPITKPVQYNIEDQLPVHPYLLGVLLGDGGISQTKGSVGITIGKLDQQEMCEHIENVLPLSMKLSAGASIDNTAFALRWRNYSTKINPAKQVLLDLKLMGKYSYDKFIPSIFLHASISDRIELLQGLMDTDGWVDKNKNGGTHVGFGTTSIQLKDGMVELVQSLGGTVRVIPKSPWYYDKNRNRKYCHTAWSLTLSLPREINPFKLLRKRNIYQSRTIKYLPSRAIVNVECIGKKEAQCIKVDALDGLYLTDNFIVTHNTPESIAYAMLEKRKTLIVCPATVKINWEREIEKFTGLKAVMWDSKGPNGQATDIVVGKILNWKTSALFQI